MIRVFLALLGVLVLLNVLTFLMVVNQEPAASTPSSGTGAAKASSAIQSQLKKIDRLETSLKSLRSTVDNLARKVDGLPRRIASSIPRSTPAAAPRVPAGAPAARGGAVSRARVGPTEYSTVTPEASGSGVEASNPEDEVPAEGALPPEGE